MEHCQQAITVEYLVPARLCDRVVRRQEQDPWSCERTMHASLDADVEHSASRHPRVLHALSIQPLPLDAVTRLR
jgi:hypothetical protein